MKTCTYCQSAISDQDTRCPSCGSAVLKTGSRGKAAPQKSSKVGLLLLIGVLGLVIVAGAGAGAFLMLGQTSEPTPEVELTSMLQPKTSVSAPKNLADIKSRGKLRVAADPEAPPFLSKKADGTYEGFEYALMRTLADRAGVPLEIVPMDYDGLVSAVVAGEAEMAVGQLARVPGAPVAWSVSYLQYSLCLVVPQNARIAYTNELTGKRVGHYDDPAVITAAAGLIGSYQKVLFSNYGYFDQLVAGQLDAVLYDCPLARHELKPYQGKLRIASDALNVFSYSIALPPTEATLQNEVNALLVELGQQGLLGQLKQRWLSESAGEGTDKFVMVRTGETLEELAQRALGSAARAEDLYKANADIIGDDRKALYGGMRLRIP